MQCLRFAEGKVPFGQTSAESLRYGKHLDILELQMEHQPTERWGLITHNQIPRYHYLSNDIELQIPFLTIDFKHYFTLPRDELYKQFKNHYLGTINELFRESLFQRFAYYLSRIGLPSMAKAVK